jgi:hypothetical protein
MGGLLSIALSYTMWKEYHTIMEIRSFKRRRDAWVELHKMLEEQEEMEKEDKK